MQLNMKQEQIPKVFLGGTCAGSKWRDQLIKGLSPNVTYFNPVVEDWSPDCQARELKMRDECPVVVYVISPLAKGSYSIAELIDDSNKRPDRTLFLFMHADVELNGGIIMPTMAQQKSNDMITSMAVKNGAKAFISMNALIQHLNNM